MLAIREGSESLHRNCELNWMAAIIIPYFVQAYIEL